MNQFGTQIKMLRESKALLQRQVASKLDIDTPMYSKIERGDRRAKREQVVFLAELFNADLNELLTSWIADTIYNSISNEENALRALKVVEQQIKKERNENK